MTTAEGWSSGGEDVVAAEVLGAAVAGGGTTVRVLRGVPDELELAALVAGIVARQASNGHAEASPDASAWNDRARRLGVPPAPGPSTWRWSAQR